MKGQRTEPPRLITQLIEMIGDRRDTDVILGDLYEMYSERLERKGKWFANLGYVQDFITLLLNRAFRTKRRKHSSNHVFMFDNYFKTAIRLILRQKTHNAINIFGLGIGLAITLVISLFVAQELSYDKFHEKGSRIYLLPMTWTIGEMRAPVAESTSAAGPYVMEGFSQVENMARFKEVSLILNSAERTFDEKGVLAADSTFFDVFTFPLLAGNPKDALRHPLSVVLTETTAEKYFGPQWAQEDVLSRTLEGQNKKLYRVSGVVANPPGNSHIQFDILLSMNSLPRQDKINWDNSEYSTYLLLRPGSSPAAIVAGIPELLRTKVGSWASENMAFDLVPLHDVYLRNEKYQVSHSSDIRYVYIFSVIAAMVMIIAIINYMNLSTARSLERAREVGVRKVVGALRTQLVWQFMSESFLVATFSLAIAVGLTRLSIPLFNNISGKALTMNFGAHPEWLAYMAAVLLLITILGGSYPAVILSGYKPASVLKGKLKNSFAGLRLRRLLVVAQFSISILLIICTLMIQSQLKFMSDAKLGFNKDQLIALEMDSLSRDNLATLRKEFAQLRGVESVSASMQLPVNVTMKSAVGVNTMEERQLVSVLATDPEFVGTAGLELIAGSSLTPNIEDLQRWEFMLNESALEFFHWTADEALGKEINLWGTLGTVKGVVRDFHFAPLHKPIQPLIISAGSGNVNGFSYLLVRVQGSQFSSSLEDLERTWRKLTPGSPFAFSFLNDRYKSLYLTESRLGKIMNVFSVLAILIAALGLFGLASYTIVQRTKELGIRKALGASLSNLIFMVSGNFIRLVAFSFLIAAPLSWYVMMKWLQDFHYRIEFNWWIVAAAGMSALLLATATVIYHSVEVARVNPTESLKNE